MLLFLTFLVIRFQIGRKLVCFYYRCLNLVAGFPHLQSLVWALHLQPNKVRAILKYRIGVPLYIEGRKCPHCRNGGRGKLKLSWSWDRILRHDRVRERKFAACSTASLSPVCEQKNLIPDNSRPGDI